MTARREAVGGVSPYAGKADAKVASADAKAREAKAAQREAESRADAADRRAERLEAALERIGERLDAIERRLERKVEAKPKAVERAPALAAEARIDANGGALLYGVQAIADFLGVRKRQALGLIERGHLPHYHVGRVVCANRPALAAWLDARASGASK